jgi:hypothetical protein
MNTFERFSCWISPDNITGLTFLDIGCNKAYLGEYLMIHGAKEYLGIDINVIPNENLKKYSNAHLQCISAENFLKVCKRKFDVVFCNNVIIAFSNLPDVLKQITKITNNLIIESPNPYPFFMISSDDPDYTSKLYNLEYNHAYTEVYPTSMPHEANQIKEDRYLSFLYSMGFLKMVLNRLGFVEDMSCYELLKVLDPGRYGFGLSSTDIVLKKFVMKFKLSHTPLPITWGEWNETV